MPGLQIFLLALIAGTGVTASARGQSAPTPAAQDIPAISAQPNSQTSIPIEKALYSLLTKWRYRFFIEFVGRENTPVEKHKGEDNERFRRTDYESLIGVGDGDEQAMIEAVLDASPRMIETFDQIDDRTLALLEDHARIDRIENDPDLTTLLTQQNEIVDETRVHLKREIGAVSLKKLDAFVFREFINREGLRSQSQLGTDFGGFESAASDKDSGSEAIDKVKLRQWYAFAQFFQTTGHMREHVKQQVCGAKDADSSLPACTPTNDRNAVREIVRNADDQIQLANAKEDAAIGRYHKESDPGPIPHPLPHELEIEHGRFWTAVDSGIKDLRRQLGDTEFAKFDQAVDEVFGPGLWKEASDATRLASAQH